ncbi:MAG: hypothetical protein LBK99_16520 [Opitutaceae bacterium]|jgi:hypothetical protein|nr:hypothetical protein [Opitutaceae bacterium]
MESIQNTTNEKIELASHERARLSYSERARIDGNAIDRLAFAIASRVARDYFARLMSWQGQARNDIVLVIHARETARAGKRKLPHVYMESESGFARACVEPSTLEEMALAARATLLAGGAKENERHADETMRLAFRQARRALNREREQSLDALGIETIPNIFEDEELRAIDAKRRFLAIARIYCAKRRAVFAYWKQTGSRKWRAGFIADCALLRTAFAVSMNSGHGRDASKGSAFRERVRQLRNRIESGQLAIALANN